MKKLILILSILSISSGAQATNEFPTDEIVRYVIGCMGELGEQSEQNLYTCVCRIDSIRSSMTYEEYDGGNMMERYKKMPGKKGGFFRDNKLGDLHYDKLKAAREAAFAQCPKVIHIQAKVKDKEEE